MSGHRRGGGGGRCGGPPPLVRSLSSPSRAKEGSRPLAVVRLWGRRSLFVPLARFRLARHTVGGAPVTRVVVCLRQEIGARSPRDLNFILLRRTAVHGARHSSISKNPNEAKMPWAWPVPKSDDRKNQNPSRRVGRGAGGGGARPCGCAEIGNRKSGNAKKSITKSKMLRKK